jgi:hypothetical protein
MKTVPVRQGLSESSCPRERWCRAVAVTGRAAGGSAQTHARGRCGMEMPAQTAAGQDSQWVSTDGADESGDVGFPVVTPTACAGMHWHSGGLGKWRSPVADRWLWRSAEQF